jgi:copper chaperone CopZ
MNTMAKATIHVKQHGGRSCRLESIKEQVSKIAGVSGVEANHVTDMLSFEYDPEKATMDEIRRNVEAQLFATKRKR